MSNSLLEEFDTPYGTVPFNKIKEDDFLGALETAITQSKQKLSSIKEISQEKVDFQSTVLVMEDAEEKIEQVAGIFFNLLHAETNKKLQDISKKFSPILAKYSNDIYLDEDIFQRIKWCFEKKDVLNLSGEEDRLLTHIYDSFIRNGALLSSEQKEKLRTIDQELSTLGLKFGENLLAETNNYVMEVKDESKLQGLPQNVLEEALMEGKKRDKEGTWAFTLKAPSYLPFMKYMEDRNLRKEMYMAYATRAMTGERDNLPLIKKMTSLRKDRANLLNFKTHAEYVLKNRMAKDIGTVNSFLKDLLSKSKSFAQKEIQEISEFAKKISGEDFELKRWDYSFYFEKLVKEKFQIDEETLRPYFPLESVTQGAFNLAQQLYGITFTPMDNVTVYHKDVQCFKVTRDDEDDFVGIFYCDFFPREGKNAGAWMTNFKDQGLSQGKIERPHVSIVCNFPRPTKNRPSLLSLMEVTTLFHEFGHALHALLSNCHYRSLSGTNVLWDFVELPSQFMENFVFEKKCLDHFAKHYETQENIPEDMFKRIKEYKKFHAGISMLRQLSFGILDMAFHGVEELPQIDKIDDFEKGVLDHVSLFPHVPDSCISTQFSHIFNGGYSAGYYSYKWAEVLEADAFDLFLEKGIDNPDVAKSFYENILSKGNSEEPNILFERFRGRGPEIEPLLKREGLM